MPYSTKDDVRKRLSELTDPTVFDGILDSAIAEADSRIDGRLSLRYEVPFSAPAPAQIVNLSANLATVLALLDTAANSGFPDQAKALERQVEAQLERLSDGHDSLPGLPVKPRFYSANQPAPPACAPPPWLRTSPLDGWRWK